eukprot:TRINITY_DN6862_c0_g1_i1.p1 TRINITY_DN6862_c0_g1~~TRINITY_DN6862_c0_g1_i1.p1  ORF type:complete len:637 (+),score=181.21 TRINITY_DN6862_c0_g1_i1:262-1911(+)
MKEQEDSKRLADRAIRSQRLRKLEALQNDVKSLKLPDEKRHKGNSLLLRNDNPNVIVEDVTDEPEDEPDEDTSWKKRKAPQTADDDDELFEARKCHICQQPYHILHHFYDKLCPECASLNWKKRNQTCDLTGRYALLTGARIKIGYATALSLLRNNAHVIATTRFPHAAAIQFSKEEDYQNWKERLHIYALDLRFLKQVEEFCQMVIKTYPHLDIIINNAAQTIRRPPAFYAHLMENEMKSLSDFPPEIQLVIKGDCQTDTCHSQNQETRQILNISEIFSEMEGRSDGSSETPSGSTSDVISDVTTDVVSEVSLDETLDETSNVRCDPMEEENSVSTLTNLEIPEQFRNSVPMKSMIPMLPEDLLHDPKNFPVGKLDIEDQQLDLRRTTSWVLEQEQVSSLELAEVHAINALAPFIINGHLLPLLKKSPFKEKYIVNVSSVEGQFYHIKSTKHPHTNMAKASMNMMTRTSAPHYAKMEVYMCSVDTGWISDMNPVHKSHNIAKRYGEYFRNPLDCTDAAARVLDPIMVGINERKFYSGKFFKDYEVSPW